MDGIIHNATDPIAALAAIRREAGVKPAWRVNAKLKGGGLRTQLEPERL